jgi:hypothetical protein
MTTQAVFNRLVDALCAAAFWAGLVAAGVGLWTAAPANLRPPRPLPEGVRSPMLALELLRDEDRVKVPAFVDPPELALPAQPAGRERPSERDRLRAALDRDRYFIAAYDAFLSITGVMLARTPFGVPLIASANVAAYFDVQENRAIRALLNGESSRAPRGPSLWKWRFVFIAFLLMTPALLQRGGPVFWRAIGFTAAVFSAWGGVAGLLATAYGNDQMLESAAGRLAPAFVIAAIFFGTRGILSAGLLPALDWLAGTRWLGWLSRWPRADPPEPVDSLAPRR